MQSISMLWLQHRDAEQARPTAEGLDRNDPEATAMIAYYDAARTIALAIEREELKPDDVLAEVDQFFLKLQDFLEEQKIARANLQASENVANDES